MIWIIIVLIIIVIFSYQKVKERPKFMIGDNELEIVDEYKYLGFSMKYSGQLIVSWDLWN